MQNTPGRAAVLAAALMSGLLSLGAGSHAAAARPAVAVTPVGSSPTLTAHLDGGTGTDSATAVPVTPSGSVWDDLAQCESSGDWSINTGNGYHGGLQFHPGTWDAYGGEEFADRAYEATRDEQIVVAQRVQADQGWRAWPTCTRQLGLR